ncbi:hypothetical protein BpHYR1_041026 [Brachionus plicatilis]|uniref:Uncharacterized protein n=1 Tax=Brachionus plicatilis TaxID=10195 RepID=A0A3M7RTM7_BRAPC|nr:hypothetical protein BpHYR1_041026 [Brachionus plicatilis]
MLDCFIYFAQKFHVHWLDLGLLIFDLEFFEHVAEQNFKLHYERLFFKQNRFYFKICSIFDESIFFLNVE